MLTDGLLPSEERIRRVMDKYYICRQYELKGGPIKFESDSIEFLHEIRLDKKKSSPR